MTRDDSIDRLIEDYLDDYEGYTPLPDAVRDAIRAELPSTRQRPAWWPRPRFFEMNNHTTRNYGIAAAAVVAAGAIALNAFSGSRTGAPFGTPSTSPVVSASPSAAPTARQLTTGDKDLILAAGRYRIGDPFPVEFALDLPSGWSPRNLDVGAAEFGAAGTNGSPYLGFFLVRNVYRDGCRTEKGMWRGLGAGPPLDAATLTRALRNIGHVSAGPISHVTIGGREATRFTLSNDISPDNARCTEPPWVNLFDPVNGTPARTIGGTMQEMWVVTETARDAAVLIVGEVRDSVAAADQAAIDSALASLEWANATP